MGYRIGKVEQEFGNGHKFAVVKDGEDFVYHAKRGALRDLRDGLSNTFWDDLICENRLENVVCCGLVDNGGRGKKCLGIWSGPLGFKPAYFGLMENFKEILLEEYRKFCSELEFIDNMCRKNE